MKSFHDLERICKGFASHRRLQLLNEIGRNPELSVESLAGNLNIDYRTVSSHLKRLEIAGLIMKRHEGHHVCHKVTSRGNKILKFLRTLE